METDAHLCPDATPAQSPSKNQNSSHPRSPPRLLRLKAKFGKLSSASSDLLHPKEPVSGTHAKRQDAARSPAKSARSDASNGSKPINIKARLHALLDSNHSYSTPCNRLSSGPPVLPIPKIPSLEIGPSYFPPPNSTATRQKDPPFLKVRVITWNHGYSLPKGELDVLLGSVPPYEGPAPNKDSKELPEFKLGDEHPYHIIVVAGQECPSQSGMPLALGGGLRLELGKKERRLEKSKSKKEAKESSKVNIDDEGNPEEDDTKSEPQVIVKDFSYVTPFSPQTTAPSSPVIPNSLPYQQVPAASALSIKSFGSQLNQANLSTTSVGTPHHTPGWSSILEDWFCNGVGSLQGARPVAPKSPNNAASFAVPPTTPTTSSPNNGFAIKTEPTTPNLTVSPSPSQGSGSTQKSKEVEPMKWQVPEASEGLSSKALQNKPGPYVLHCKERLMAISLYVFVHRDVQHLIQGTSKSSVSTGMLKGRVGNKGGIGVSMKVAGTTLLFINAHLAAHEGRSAARLANMAKIKADLQVETFLAPDDPRTVAEDLTDRFDHSFICGDLNFRLDVSRLHAEWLVSQRHFNDALKFDQLHRIMETGQGFHGFTEALIDFPPTFKYDIMRTIKRHRGVRTSITGKAMKRIRRSKGGEPLTDDVINEAVEQDEGAADADADSSSDSEGGLEAGDAASLASSIWTSQHSRATTDVSDSEDEIQDQLSPAAKNAIANSSTGVAQRLLTNPAAVKAKAKLLALINRSPSPSPVPEQSTARVAQPAAAPIPQHKHTLSETNKALQHGSPTKSAKSASSQKRSLDVPRVSGEGLKLPSMKRSHSTRSQKEKVSEEDLNSDEDRGVYDTSSKQRVPSWCDRILFKSAIVPGPDDLPPDDPSARSPTRRLGSMLSPFRRGRRDSSISNGSSDDSHHPGSLKPQVGDHSAEPAQGGSEARPAPILSRFFPNNLGRGSNPLNSPQTNRGTHLGSNQLLPLSSRTSQNSSVNLIGPRRSFSASAVTTSSQDSPSPKLVVSHSFPFNQPLRLDTVIREPSPSPPAEQSALAHISGHFPNWKWPFPSLFGNRESPPASASQPTLSPPILLPPLHRRGDITCLKYDTLDDKQMRRLEGRSDHRPVMGDFAVYL